MTDYKFSQTYTNSLNQHFDVDIYPDHNVYINKTGFNVSDDMSGQKLSFDENCNQRYPKKIITGFNKAYPSHDKNDKINPKIKKLKKSFDDMNYSRSQEPYDMTWLVNWLTENPNKHDHIPKIIKMNSLDEGKYKCNYECEWYCNKKHYILTIFNMAVYLLRCDAQIIYSLCAPNYELQPGDSRTYIYLLNEKHIVIHNYGDVSSAIVLKYIL